MYQEIAALNQKGNVLLVRNKIDGLLYVKKQIRTPYPEIYFALKTTPIKNTPQLVEVLEDAGKLTIIEEYLAGTTLKERLEQLGRLSEKETADIGIKLCRILQALHSRKLVHRDVKPSNIMLLPDGGVYLLDFDAVKPLSQGSRDTVLLGTQGYAAPEQYGFAASTPQTDLYALGVLLNICLCGKLPTETICEGKFRNIIKTCVMPDPKDRYNDVSDLLAVLKKIGRQKLYFLPPGFRTLKWYKMLLACLGYGFLLCIVFSMSDKQFDTQVDRCLCQMTILLTGVLNVFFFADYMNFRSFFPFMRSKYKVLRGLGFLLVPSIIFWTLIIVTTIIDELISLI